MSTRRGVRFVVAVAIGACAGPGLAAQGHGLGARVGTLEEQAATRAIYTQVETVIPNETARARVAAEAPRSQLSTTATRPNAVDNSARSWFPPIGDQGSQNSCVAWAVGYYYDTYAQARDEGLDVASGSATHLCSPSFLYPLLNDGRDQGAYLEAGVAMLSVTGCSSLALTPYTEYDYTTWPSEAAWVEALNRRTAGAYWISGNTESGLEATKQLLANGRLAVVFVDVYANLYYDYPSARGVDSGVLYAPDGPYTGGHTVTLVGYDDAKSYRDQRDGRTHTGAFLLANSWGSSWGVTDTVGKKGFLWISYDAFRERRFVYDPVYTDDLPAYRPAAYAVVGVDHGARGSLDLSGGAGTPAAATGLTSLVLHATGGTQLGVSDTGAIAVGLTDVATPLAGTRLADVFISLGVSAGASSGIIARADFFSDSDGDGTYVESSSPQVPVAVAAGSTGYAFLPLFRDLSWGNWTYPSIEKCYQAGLVGGYADGSYRPNAVVTRDQMAVYLSRALAGGEEAVPPGPATATFSDVPTAFWAFKHIEYVVTRGVAGGYRDRTYRPRSPVSRGAMAVFVARSLAGSDDQVPAGPSTATFPDVPVGAWDFRHVEYLAARGVVKGYADGRYWPDASINRGQLAVYLAKAFCG